jgi:adenylyltransferase/sulfurtransferase
LLEGPVKYDATAHDSSVEGVRMEWLTESAENAVIDVIGAGAIGVHLLESLAPMLGEGCRLRVFDPDIIESVNLPSQTIYSKEDIGRSKVTAVAEKVQSLSRPGVGIEPYAVTYQNRPKSLLKASVRIIAADNWAVRKYVNDLSFADGVPITEAGSSPLAAQQRTYLPGQTACLACRIPDLAEKAAMETAPNSCSESPALTLPGTVCIAGGILAIETFKALRPEQFGSPSQGTITYDARFSQRFGIVDQQLACRH